MSLGQVKKADEIRIVFASDMVANPGEFLPFEQIVAAQTALEHPARQITVWNRTDGDVMLCLTTTPTDSLLAQVADQFFIPANGYWTDDTAANKQGVGSRALYYEEGTIFYCRASLITGSTPVTTGFVTLSVMYAEGD